MYLPLVFHLFWFCRHLVLRSDWFSRLTAHAHLNLQVIASASSSLCVSYETLRSCLKTNINCLVLSRVEHIVLLAFVQHVEFQFVLNLRKFSGLSFSNVSWTIRQVHKQRLTYVVQETTTRRVSEVQFSFVFPVSAQRLHVHCLAFHNVTVFLSKSFPFKKVYSFQKTQPIESRYPQILL